MLISSYNLADFLWIPLREVAEPEFLRELEDSDLVDFVIPPFFFGFTASFCEMGYFTLFGPYLGEPLNR